MEDQIIQVKNNYSHFKDELFRPGQLEAVEFILKSTKSVVVICAPTGSGKTLIGMIAGEMMRGNGQGFAYCAFSKQLQSQLEGEFPEAKTMQGRGNFSCIRYRHLKADQCTNSRNSPCDMKASCPYLSHKKSVLNHPRQVLNYHYFLTEANYVGQFSNYPILIADEADILENLLTEFVGLFITEKNLKELEISPPRYKTATSDNGLNDWKAWAENIFVPSLYSKIHNVENTLENIPVGSDQHIELGEKLQVLRNLWIKSSVFSDNVDNTWVCEQGRQSWRFSPTWLTSQLATLNFFGHMKKVVLMSATFPPIHIIAKTLGIEAGDIDYMELPSTFPVKNRQVYLDPVADMSYKTFEEGLNPLLNEIERIINLHPNEKGIIHTVSWKLNEAVMSIESPRLITHSSKDKDINLKEFKESPQPLIFVSPSSARGVDLPDDLCRFIIMPKAPFKSLASKLTSNRVFGGQLGAWWYRSLCAQEIVQSCGRAVRHKDDWAVAYLLDRQICKMVTDNQSLFPRYWLESVEVM